MTRGIVKELSLIGSRVCTREQFGEALDAMIQMQRSGAVDFSRLATEPRRLSDLAAAIGDVAAVREIAKILIRPE
jgi:threonine dehydrogenase-like Zn-dependent dehydrogenase